MTKHGMEFHGNLSTFKLAIMLEYYVFIYLLCAHSPQLSILADKQKISTKKDVSSNIYSASECSVMKVDFILVHNNRPFLRFGKHRVKVTCTYQSLALNFDISLSGDRNNYHSMIILLYFILPWVYRIKAESIKMTLKTRLW